MCKHTKPHTSPMYILFSPHHEDTIIFVILFFCGEGEITKHFFAFVRNYKKIKVIVMSGWKDDIYRDKILRALITASCVSLLHVSFVIFTLFWWKRTSDKTMIIVI